jgi:hypothetical protein
MQREVAEMDVICRLLKLQVTGIFKIKKKAV